MADEIFDGADMVGQFFRERQGVADQTGNALPQRVVEAFNMIGFARVLGNRFVMCGRNDALITNGVSFLQTTQRG